MDSNVLNHDIVTEILLHLPLTSVLRLRSVCKSWRDHMDSQVFRKWHIQQHAGGGDDTLLVQFSFRQGGVSELSMFSRRNGKLYSKFLPASQDILDYHLKRRFDTTKAARRAQIAGPANGLICIYYSDSRAPVAVCNPSLGHTSILPTCLPEPNPSSMPFEPNHHMTVCRNFGIWFDKVAQDYVVLQLLSCNTIGSQIGFHLHASLYSKATNSWRELAVGGSNIIGHGLYVNIPIDSSCKNSSFSYWLGFDTESNRVILSFDFRNEGFRILNIPYLETLNRLGKMKIFAEGDDSFLVFNSGEWEAHKWFNIFWLRIEENRLQLKSMQSVEPFDGYVIPKALYESGCVVLQYEHVHLILYNYDDEECVGCFEMKRDMVKIFEYRGSFVLP
ncbi:putative F-box protein [Salvia divinorum]|uniref:F-box protein n=1 Tax=Salvia divinorum TaxID=28513 RepID=A0ABD1GG03_SALDI